MPIYRGIAGVNREIKKLYRGVNGMNREIKEVWRGMEGVNRKIFSSSPICTVTGLDNPYDGTMWAWFMGNKFKYEYGSSNFGEGASLYLDFDQELDVYKRQQHTNLI